MTKTVKILNLYPQAMNVYGDQGNVQALSARVRQYGYEPEVINYNVGDKFPASVDIVIGGGGQDSGQDTIQADLLKIGPQLRQLAKDGAPMLVVCGLYQLFGRYFVTEQEQKIRGIEIFNMITVAGPKRIIGNVVAASVEFGTIVGFENHSGVTTLHEHQNWLSIVRKGVGNNGRDKQTMRATFSERGAIGPTEGAIEHNVLGTYLHGPILPKNPRIMDFLVATAVKNKYGDEPDASQIDDTLAEQAQKTAAKRPR